MMSYLTCAQVPEKPDDGRYNDAFYCDPEYDRLFDAQKTELDEPTRIDYVHQALQRFYDQAPYVVLYLPGHGRGLPQRPASPGFVRQPADTGPVIYTQSDPSYTLIKPVSTSSGSSSGSGNASRARAATAAVIRTPG